MSKSTIWLSYDLGVRGDYEGIYSWLDQHKAKECGDSLAVLTYEYTGQIVEALKADLGAAMQTTKRTRIYAIYRDNKTKKMKGIFLFGGRRAPPWTGYGGEGEEQSDDES